MNDTVAEVAVVEPAAASRRHHGFRRGFYRFRQSRLSVLGLVLVVLLLLLALLGPLIAPYPQDLAGAVRTAARFQPPQAAYWFGTNELGQDVLSLVFAGARISLLAGLAVVLIGAAFGLLVGAVAGFFGGWIDEVLMRLVDLVLTLPSLVLAMAVAAALGPGLGNMIIAIALSWWPGYARLVRGEVAAKKEEAFVVAARATGAGVFRLLRRHILPNILSPVIIKMSLDMGFAILTVASLGFIGIGVRPPTPEWGSQLAVARGNMPDDWWTAIFPGMAIFVAVFAFNLLGDGLRDLLDPAGAAMTPADPLLRIRDLHLAMRSFDGEAHVLNGIDLDVHRGEIWGLVGETGCGKSLTGLSISRLVPTPPAHYLRGTIRFDGQDVLAMPEGALRALRGRRIGMIFQDPTTNLNPLFTVGDQLIDVALHAARVSPEILGLGPSAGWWQRRRAARAKAVEMLAHVGIRDAAARIGDYPHQFSGGMRQRVLIAMALIGRPDLLVADEPTTALDVSVQAQILRLIHDMVQEQRLGVLFITHNLGVVAELCTHVAVMYAGNIVETGAVREVLKHPAHPYTRGLLAAVPVASTRRGELRGLAGAPPDLLALPPGCRFAPRCPYAGADCRQGVPTTRRVGPLHHAACLRVEAECVQAA